MEIQWYVWCLYCSTHANTYTVSHYPTHRAHLPIFNESHILCWHLAGFYCYPLASGGSLWEENCRMVREWQRERECGKRIKETPIASLLFGNPIFLRPTNTKSMTKTMLSIAIVRSCELLLWYSSCRLIPSNEQWKTTKIFQHNKKEKQINMEWFWMSGNLLRKKKSILLFVDLFC